MKPKEPSAEIIAKYGQLKKDMAEYEMHESNPENINAPQGLKSKKELQIDIDALKDEYSYFTFTDGL